MLQPFDEMFSNDLHTLIRLQRGEYLKEVSIWFAHSVQNNIELEDEYTTGVQLLDQYPTVDEFSYTYMKAIDPEYGVVSVLFREVLADFTVDWVDYQIRTILKSYIMDPPASFKEWWVNQMFLARNPNLPMDDFNVVYARSNWVYKLNLHSNLFERVLSLKPLVLYQEGIHAMPSDQKVAPCISNGELYTIHGVSY